MAITRKGFTRSNLRLMGTGLLAVLVLLLLSAQVLKQQQRLQESQQWISHTLEVQAATHELLIDMLDGSNAIRGYLITGDQNYLPPYQHMLDSSEPSFDILLKLTAANMVQQHHLALLKPLIQERIEISRVQYQLYQQQGAKAALENVRKGQGLKTNNQIRQTIALIQQEELHLLKQRTQARDEEARQSLINTSLILAMLGLLSAGLIWTNSRESQLKAQHIAERELLNAELETRNANLEAANESLQQADRLKNEFLSAMSHELRTPLNSIIGFTGLMRMGIPGPLNDEQKKQLTMVDDSAKHLLHLINDLLDLSRIEAGRSLLEREQFDLCDVVKEVFATVTPMANNKRLNLISNCGAAIPLHTDRRKVYQVLLNLVNNAVKFSDRGDITVACRKLSDRCEISVSDQGIGIRPDQLALLFQAFRQADGTARRVYEGTGLGLYLSKKLVGMLDGDIRAESEYGKGSRFIFTLPLPARGGAA